MALAKEEWCIDTWMKNTKVFRMHRCVRATLNVRTFQVERTELRAHYTSNFPLDVFAAIMVTLRDNGGHIIPKRVLNFIEK